MCATVIWAFSWPNLTTFLIDSSCTQRGIEVTGRSSCWQRNTVSGGWNSTLSLSEEAYGAKSTLEILNPASAKHTKNLGRPPKWHFWQYQGFKLLPEKKLTVLSPCVQGTQWEWPPKGRVWNGLAVCPPVKTDLREAPGTEYHGILKLFNQAGI